MTVAADRMRSKRQAFAAPGSSLDRIVRLLAVGLPALVGVVAAMMLITPLSPRGEISFLLDRNKVAVAEDRLRVDDAMYRGQDNRGRPFSLVAGEAVQRSNAVPLVELDRLTARLALTDGPAVLSAQRGTYAIDREQVGIPGQLSFTAADGYELAARGVTLDLASRVLTGSGRVSGVIPAGRFQADSMRVDLEARTITLRGNARMTMVPGRLAVPRGLNL
ncbi:LPS export ABC transporter periplasmic protein LptC [Erythrobacter arachoides]|uniref:LPS export ABC transporter periplasmic protein LptC n=1 Tax=Aurantiacibacter arachoides TaxID=1850444 RepID=A0A844ZUJ6_9SPHN|nr:LPS export ABC transporter periplasmic protein LptC [Aurantiacibacter arachoides]MXO91991.1 LPS export ABC transporter periplasmic protein LptC [Aurantiacibacter arachoides]GGD60600.1 hypothetical protein GCM10011411_21010 [Aurantiacibacter arachoides]